MEFGLPEMPLGIVPDAGALQRLPRRIPHNIAMEMFLLGRRMTAPEAAHYGLVNKVVPAEDLAIAAQEIAGNFAKGPTKAFGGLKRLLQTAFSDTMETQLDKESVSVAAMMHTHDAPHAIASFLKKERPEFRGE